MRGSEMRRARLAHVCIYVKPEADTYRERAGTDGEEETVTAG